MVPEKDIPNEKLFDMLEEQCCPLSVIQKGTRPEDIGKFVAPGYPSEIIKTLDEQEDANYKMYSTSGTMKHIQTNCVKNDNEHLLGLYECLFTPG